MIRFFIKGLLRDRQRSLLPIIVVSIGVMLCVLIQAWVSGILGDIIDYNSKFATGHVKIMSKAYNEIKDQVPNDLALLESDLLLQEIKEKYPDINWAERISFGGLMDAPDAYGETMEQGPAMGMAIDLISGESLEAERLNLENILVRGSLPGSAYEVLLSEEFSQNLKVGPGDQVTLITSTMFGSMSITNFTVVGTIRFGAPVLDKGGLIADISAIRSTLDMEDAVSEILGYFKEGFYDDEYAKQFSASFNKDFSDPSDKFSPVMVPLSKQNDLLSGYLSMIEYMISIVVSVFMIAMAIVLWNAGLLGGLRRYGEMGLRLAIGENKSHIYRSLLSESLVVGIVGSFFGTLIGIIFAKMLEQGLDFSSMLQGSTMMMSGIYRAHVTATSYYIGFIPGILATLLGTALAGIGIYRRQTANLFKELQA